MKKHLDDIVCRRRILLEKIRIQRTEVAEISLHLQKPLALVDTGIKALHFMRRHPVLVSSGVAVIMALHRKGLTGMAAQVWRVACIYLSTAVFASRCAGEQHDTGSDP